MLTINYIRNNKEKIIIGLEKRYFKNIDFIDKILNLDLEKRKIQTEIENKRFQINDLSKKIGELIKNNQENLANNFKTEVTFLKNLNALKEKEINTLDEKINELLIAIPNIPNDLVKKGKSPNDNEIVKENNINLINENIKIPHWEILEKFNLVDFVNGVKISGAGFPIFKNFGAKIQRSLISFFIDEAIKEGYTEYHLPLLINEESAFGTGQLPDKDGQMYYIEKDKLYLIPTSEVPLTNIYRDQILNENDLPIKLTGYTQCFRREAGSYGKDVRGLNRLHQFDKVEIVQIVHPDFSDQTLETMKNHVESLLNKLELPYRILRLCGGDTGFTSSITYDFEVYSMGQKKWLEVSSVSNFYTFQSNRMKIRYKDKDKTSNLVHTLNGSALAIPRILIALLENNYNQKNKIVFPKILKEYLKFDTLEI